MSLLRIKQADGSWSNIPAIKGADGIDGKDGAVQYTAGRYIQIDEDTQTINCTVKIGDLVIIDAVPVKDSTNVVSSGGVYDALEAKADKTEIAGLGGEAGFITNSVEDLKNYYKKSETYSQEEVNSLLGNLTRLTLEVVQELPEVGTEHIIYLVPNNESGNNIYEEWIFVQSKWEMIGTTEVDLGNYYTKEEIDALLALNDSQAQLHIYPIEYEFATNSTPQWLNYPDTTSSATLNKINELYKKGIYKFTIRYTNPGKAFHLDMGIIIDPSKHTITRVGSSGVINSGGNGTPHKTIKLQVGYGSYTYDSTTDTFGFNGSNFAALFISDPPTYVNSSDVLTKGNTTAFTPSADYHPATKKYVDDTVANASTGGEDGSATPIFEITTDITCRDWFKTKEQVWNTQINNASLTLGLQNYINHVKDMLIEGKNIPILKLNLAAVEALNNSDWEYHTYDLLHLTNGYSSDTAGPITATRRPTFFTATNGIWQPTEYHAYYTKRLMFYVEWDENDTATVTQVRLTSFRKDFLARDNTNIYTPTGDYNPATKKYVDDAVANAGDDSSTPAIYFYDLNLSGFQFIDYTFIDKTSDQTTRFYELLNKIISDGNENNFVIVVSNAVATVKKYMLTLDPDSNKLTQGGSIKLSGTQFWNSSKGLLKYYVCTISGTSSITDGVLSPSGSHTIWTTMSNLIPTDNTTLYTPSNDYNPATKKYVDDAVAASGGSGGGSADLSNYYTKEEIDALPLQEDLDIHVVKSDFGGSNPYWADASSDVVIKFMEKLTELYKQGQHVRRIRITTNSNPSVYWECRVGFNGNIPNIEPIMSFVYDSDGNITQRRKANFVYGTFYYDEASQSFKHSGGNAIAFFTSAGDPGIYAKAGDVLTKTNANAFTPTGDYNPATKKYVDDAVANAGSGGTTGDFLPYTSVSTAGAVLRIPTGAGKGVGSSFNGFGYLSGGTFINQLKNFFTYHDVDVLRNRPLLLYVTDASDPSFSGIGRLSDSISWFKAYGGTFTVFVVSTTNPCYYSTITGSASYSESTGWELSNVILRRYGIETEFLRKDNTAAFTPTNDYHPATKKYVDDAVANAEGEGPDLTPYAKLTDVLTKTNTTEYTPASAYHPATKQYVDQTVASVGGITEESDPTVPLYVKNITQDMITKWNNASDETALTTKIESIVATMVGENISISYNTEDAWYNNKGVITDTSAIDNFILNTNEKIGNGEYPSIKIYLTRDDSYATNKTTCVDLTYNGDYFYGTLYPTSSHSIMMSAYGTEACMIKVDLAVNNTTIEIQPLVTLKTLVSNNDVASYNGEHNFYTGLDDNEILETANTLYTDLNIAMDHQFLEFPKANGYTPPNGRELRIGLYKGRPAIAFDNYDLNVSVGVFNTYDEVMASSTFCTGVTLGSTTYNLCTVAETKLDRKHFTIRHINSDGYIESESGGTQLSWILGIPEWTGIGTSSGGGHETRPVPEFLIPLITKDTGETLWATLYAFQDTNDTESLIFRLCLVNHLNDTRFTGKTYDLGGLCLTTPIVEIPGGDGTHTYVFKPVPSGDSLTIGNFKVFQYYRWLETPEVE